MSLRPLLVGDTNPHSRNVYFDLYPLPENCAGGRLAKILGMTAKEYLRTFDRVNVDHMTPGLRESFGQRPGVFVFGARACKTLLNVPYHSFSRIGETNVYVLPHPSGRNRIWNEPAAETMTRRMVRNVLAGRDCYA